MYFRFNITTARPSIAVSPVPNINHVLNTTRHECKWQSSTVVISPDVSFSLLLYQDFCPHLSVFASLCMNAQYQSSNQGILGSNGLYTKSEIFVLLLLLFSLPVHQRRHHLIIVRDICPFEVSYSSNGFSRLFWDQRIITCKHCKTVVCRLRVHRYTRNMLWRRLHWILLLYITITTCKSKDFTHLQLHLCWYRMGWQKFCIKSRGA